MTTTCQVVEREIASLRLYARNARAHSKKQLKQIASSIQRFGFTNPVLVSEDREIIAGHGRVEAAKTLGWKKVLTIALAHLSPAERRAYVLADNKLTLNAGWDREILAIELQSLVDLEFDVELTGFSLAEVDFLIDEAGAARANGSDAAEDAVPRSSGPPVSRPGDLWELAAIACCAVTPAANLISTAWWQASTPTSCSPIRRTTWRSTATSVASARSSAASLPLPQAR